MPANILVLNGPNLNLLGIREPHIYGQTTLGQIEQRCRDVAATLNLAIEFRQSNSESELIDWIHAARENAAGIVINPAGYSFTSIALLDALKGVGLPVVEVHISNIHRRDPIYHNSLVSKAAVGVLCGFGAYGYELALQAMANHLRTLQTAAS
jgi:3-dehydroquinate dehydratase-2